LEYIAELVVTAKEAANRVKLNQLDASQGPKVPVVHEFPDVFFEELSVMPIDRDIESVIKLVPILLLYMYKRPYRMAAKQLAELKNPIKELLEKGYIRPSSPHWGAPVIFVPKTDGTKGVCVYYHASKTPSLVDHREEEDDDGFQGQQTQVCQ
jgi:hypothetical protein